MTTPQPQRKYGALAPIPHPKAWKFGDLPEAQQPRPRQWRAKIFGSDRLQIHNSCVGNTIASMCEQMGIVEHASAMFPWTLARGVEGSSDVDTGIYPNDGWTATLKQGVCDEELMPETAELPTGVPVEAIGDASPRANLIEFRQCTSFDELLDATAAWDSPSEYCLRIWPEFENPGPDHRLPPFVSQPTDSYHSIEIRSYDDDAQEVTLKNWWPGEQLVVMTYAQARMAFSDGWVVRLINAPAPDPVTPTPDPVTPTPDPVTPVVDPTPTPEPTPEPASIEIAEPKAGATLAGDSASVTFHVTGPYTVAEVLAGNRQNPNAYFTSNPLGTAQSDVLVTNLPTDGSEIIISLGVKTPSGTLETGIAVTAMTKQVAPTPEPVTPTPPDPADLFWPLWKAYSDYVADNRSIEGLTLLTQLGISWSAYFQRQSHAGAIPVPAIPPMPPRE